MVRLPSMSPDRPSPPDSVDPAAVREAAAAFELKLRRRLAENPADSLRLEALGRLLVGENRHEEALDVLTDLAARKPKLAQYRLLADSQIVTGRLADAAATLERIFAIERTPANLLLWAKFKTQAGQAAEASELLAAGRAWFPEDANVVVQHASSLGSDLDESPVVEALQAAASTPAFADNLKVLETLAILQARQSRRAKGLNPYGAASWEDFLVWSETDGLARYRAALDRRLASAPATPDLILARAWVGLVDQAWEESERLIAMVRSAGDGAIVDTIHFDKAFYRDLERQTDSAILSDFVPLEELRHGPPAPTLFLPSDPVYFRKFTLPLLDQIAARAPDLRVHVHLLDGDAAEWRDCLQAALGKTPAVSLSAEASGARQEPRTAAVYYHAVRLVRFHEYILRNRCPGLMIDVDADLTGDPALAMARFMDRDLGLFATPQSFEPWHKFAAGCIGAAPTAGGLAFTRLVAAYIARLRSDGLGYWGMDQVAMFGVYTFLAREGRRPDTGFFQSDIAGHVKGRPAVFHFVAGHKKHVK